MVLSKLFSPFRSRDKENEKKNIINGYPLTTSPVIPDILKHQVEFKKVKRGSMDIVGFTLARERSNLVRPESLELFRKRLLAWCTRAPEFCKQFESKLPKNVIAISLALANFELGESCQEYKLIDSMKPSENGHFTYRKLSECIQCTYYNEKNVEFLAGITFYPAPHGRPQLLKSNNALLFMAIHSVIEYPLRDRHKSWFMVQCKHYGRFCSVAGKHVLLTCEEEDGVPRHVEYDHVTNEYEVNLCGECCQDFYTYKWEEPKKETPAIIATAASAIIDAMCASVPVATTASKTFTVSCSSSTEILIEGLNKVDVNSGVENDIDAEFTD